MAKQKSGINIGAERRDPAEVQAEREERRAAFEKRNAEAVAREQQVASETPKQREKRRSAIFQARQQRAAEHEERNRKAMPGAPADKMRRGADVVPENKSDRENTDTDPLDGVDFASGAARDAADDAGLTAAHFKRRRRGSERGFTKEDVERIAAATDEADEGEE